MLQKIIHVWGRAEEFLVVVLMILASYLTFQEVVLRYVFGTGWSGSYEITVMSLIWCTFFGVSLGVRENIHIGVDLLVKKIRSKSAAGSDYHLDPFLYPVRSDCRR
jgi:C4-dicarboxylate transporter DctQ subunit